MIEKLKEEDVREAAIVYNRGLQMEIPKGYSTLDETIKHFKEVRTFVYKENQKIKGLISFKEKSKGKIKIDFICALILRKGIGKKLMMKLADFTIKENIDFVYSNVSSKDKRVMNFYENCGFKIYGRYFSGKTFMLYRIKAKPEWIKDALRRTSN
ncbi:MAG: GNAT family N-acetyltransferase [Candidatus Staskawiczbacteria bacterium]|nr:GNAT family N-acetyltransferase [Candidatus Staskawiczbacteria bacterium]